VKLIEKGSYVFVWMIYIKYKTN